MKIKPLVGILIVLCFFLIASFMSQLYFESKKAPGELSLSKLSNFYLEEYPLDRDSALGSGPIIIIAFFNPSMDTSVFFALIESIHKEYVETNRAKLIVNPIVLAEQNNTLAKQFLCLQQNQTAIEFYRNFNKKMPEKSSHCSINLSQRIAESEYLGLHGLNARFYIGLGDEYDLAEGIPSLEQLERAIRLKEITIGK